MNFLDIDALLAEKDAPTFVIGGETFHARRDFPAKTALGIRQALQGAGDDPEARAMVMLGFIGSTLEPESAERFRAAYEDERIGIAGLTHVVQFVQKAVLPTPTTAPTGS